MQVVSARVVAQELSRYRQRIGVRLVFKIFVGANQK